jgi:hypothetical protein
LYLLMATPANLTVGRGRTMIQSWSHWELSCIVSRNWRNHVQQGWFVKKSERWHFVITMIMLFIYPWPRGEEQHTECIATSKDGLQKQHTLATTRKSGSVRVRSRRILCRTRLFTIIGRSYFLTSRFPTDERMFVTGASFSCSVRNMIIVFRPPSN